MVPDTTPVLVGIGLISQREPDPVRAREPLELMVQAAEAAGRDCEAPELLREVDAAYVPRGRWRYRDPGRAIAERLGALGARSLLAHVGVLQEQLIGTACDRILADEIDAAIVVGGEAGFRRLRGRITGQQVTDSQQDTDPDEVWRASEVIMTEVELTAGLGADAPTYYAVIDSAFRHKRHFDLAKHRTAVADLYSRFSRVAAENPDAWRRTFVAAPDIRDPSPKNQMLAFPYTKMHTSDWSVDQASALLLCSAKKAREHGIPSSKWVYPLGASVSNHMVPVSERAALDRTLGAEVAANRALEYAGVTADQLDFVDLYSCFPVAVLSHAKAVGLDLERDVTITGGMRFAGGPFNNYVLHTTGQLGRRLRASPDAFGLVSSVSGVLTKHAFSVWGSSPSATYRFTDVTDEVSRKTGTKTVDPGYTGTGLIAGYTVVYDKDAASHGVAVIDTDNGRRTIARTEDTRIVSDMTEYEFTGRMVHVEQGHFIPQSDSAVVS